MEVDAHSYASFITSTGTMNTVLGVDINLTNIANAFVNCTFEPPYNCTIVPSYTNLVCGDNSSIQEGVTTIKPSKAFQTGTTYYFIVSAESSSLSQGS